MSIFGTLTRLFFRPLSADEKREAEFAKKSAKYRVVEERDRYGERWFVSSYRHVHHCEVSWKHLTGYQKGSWSSLEIRHARLTDARAWLLRHINEPSRTIAVLHAVSGQTQETQAAESVGHCDRCGSELLPIDVEPGMGGCHHCGRVTS